MKCLISLIFIKEFIGDPHINYQQNRYKQEITGLLSTRLEREKFVEILDNRGAKTGIIEIIGQKRFLEMVEGGFLEGIFPTNCE